MAAKVAPPIPSPNAASVHDFTSLLSKTLLSSAADRASPIRRKQSILYFCITPLHFYYPVTWRSSGVAECFVTYWTAREGTW